MRTYELIIVASPDLDETAFNELVQKINGWIADGGGSVGKAELWGKRKLAYPIRKKLEGIYLLMEVNLPAKFNVTLERNLRFTEPVMRYSLIVKE